VAEHQDVKALATFVAFHEILQRARVSGFPEGCTIPVTTDSGPSRNALIVLVTAAQGRPA
jgi:hypothetical protein